MTIVLFVMVCVLVAVLVAGLIGVSWHVDYIAGLSDAHAGELSAIRVEVDALRGDRKLLSDRIDCCNRRLDSDKAELRQRLDGQMVALHARVRDLEEESMRTRGSFGARLDCHQGAIKGVIAALEPVVEGDGQ